LHPAKVNATVSEMLGKCPDPLPEEIEIAASALAKAYAMSSAKPRLRTDVILHWDQLIEQWSECHDLPLFIRKQSANIGDLLKHKSSGRSLAPCDNSPAHWAIIKAFDRGVEFTLDDVRTAIDRHEVPVTLAMSKAEIAESTMKGVLAKQTNESKLGWKVDHIIDVGLNQRAKVEDIRIEDLKRHFCRLMKPSNIVLVPSRLKGLGDMPAFISFVRQNG
jgi:hypothetical protein